MRIAAQTKLGFYPAHPDAIAAICEHLEPPEGGTAILDPCAGEGLALLNLATHLGCTGKHVHAVELDSGRALKARENLPGAKILGPASFLACEINVKSFGLVYANPPFDDELGGGKREEFTFTEHSTRVLKLGGILVLVMPLSAIERNVRFQEFLDSWYEDAAIYAWPEKYRFFREVVYIGRRRKAELQQGADGHLRSKRLDLGRALPVVGTDGLTWEVPSAKGPNTFAKTTFTEAEIIDTFAGSPLEKLLKAPVEPPPKRPPLSLSGGHVSLRLASGQLNGVVYPENEPPHVVRGSSKKQPFISKPATASTNPETKVTTIKYVESEKIVLSVRTASVSGEIRTFEDGVPEAQQPQREAK